MPTATEDRCNTHRHRYSEPLIFQFILSHHLVFQKAMRTIVALSHLLRLRPRKGDIPQAKALSTVCQIRDIVAQIVPHLAQEITLMPWHTQTGALPKLIEYNQLLTAQSGPKRSSQRIETHASKALSCCCELTKVLQAITTKTTKKPPGTRKILNILDSLTQHAQRLEKSVLHAVSQQQCDENLVFFLLRHGQDFDRLHGRGTIMKLLNKLFPKGLDEAVRYVTRRYRKRGFDHLLPIINQKRAEVGV